MQYDIKKITRLAEIKEEISTLKTEADEIEAYFMNASESDLADTKYKSVSYSDESGNIATITLADNVKLIYPSFLKKIFGKAYGDVVNEEVKHSLSAPAKRLLAALYKKDYITNVTLNELLLSLDVDDNSKKTLSKKIKGVNFDRDVKNFISAGLTEKEAKENAYLSAEIVTWENFQKLLKLNYSEDEINETLVKTVLDYIDGAITVEQTPKVAVDSME